MHAPPHEAFRVTYDNTADCPAPPIGNLYGKMPGLAESSYWAGLLSGPSRADIPRARAGNPAARNEGFRFGGYSPGVLSAPTSATPRLRGRDVGGQPGLRLRWALLAALAGGLLLAVSFPPAGIWPLAVVGTALLTVALAGRGLRASFGVGLVFGVAFFFPLLSWVLNVWWFAYIALALGSAVILAVLAVAQRLLLRLPGWPLAVAGWWVGLEALRDRFPFGGFPWGRLAMSQASAPSA